VSLRWIKRRERASAYLPSSKAGATCWNSSLRSCCSNSRRDRIWRISPLSRWIGGGVRDCWQRPALPQDVSARHRRGTWAGRADQSGSDDLQSAALDRRCLPFCTSPSVPRLGDLAVEREDTMEYGGSSIKFAALARLLFQRVQSEIDPVISVVPGFIQHDSGGSGLRFRPRGWEQSTSRLQPLSMRVSCC
jgi:hypothetical protein